uniref:Uncharacterized protein n=1 Tax=Rhizophora mucronata TaxID=61149 RepID=A0A2P2QKK4_RHIMU
MMHSFHLYGQEVLRYFNFSLCHCHILFPFPWL